jgi:subtilase family serine protease
MTTFASRLPLRALALSLVAALAACSGGGGSAVAPVGTGGVPSAAAPPSTASAIRYGVETTQGAALQGPATAATVAFGVLVTMHDAAGLVAYAQAANDPSSGSYRHWLAPADIAARYGASQSDYAKVAAYFRGKGLAVASWQQRELLFVTGPRAAAEAALGAHFGTYLKNGVTFTALESAPAALAGLPIAALPGVSTYANAARVRQFVKASGSVGDARGYSPQQVAAAFDFTGAYNAGFTGKGITIGIIGTGPISASDYPAYRGLFSLAGSSTVTQVNVTDAGTAGTPSGYGGQQPSGTFATPPPTTASCTIPPAGPSASCNPEDGEAQIDTEQTFGLARDASVLFYIGYSPATGTGNTSGTNLEGLDLYPYEIQQAINDDRVDALSLSYGGGELDDVGGDFNLSGGKVDLATSPGPIEFASLAAEGVAVFASSGDQGNLVCSIDGNPNTASDLCVSYPAIDPNVVAVGGVNSPIGTNGQLTGTLTAWGAQTGGNDPNLGASSGGVSAYFPLPTFQTGAVGVIGSTRNSPDVSLVADPQTGVATLTDAAFPDGNLVPYGGTSVAAPETAAMWALVLQACLQNPTTCKGSGTGAHAYRLGDPNPLFYKAYATPSIYASTFYDVVFGDNSEDTCSVSGGTCPSPVPTPVAGYTAGVGYDRVTGIGVPFGRALIKTIAGV